MIEIDLNKSELRDLNAMLHSLDGKQGEKSFKVVNPNGKHNIAVGVDGELDITIEGHAGHYVGGMNKHANIYVTGNAGAGLAENIMSGVVRVILHSTQVLPVVVGLL
jgi:glutamate synthase domain-containing protein 3